MRRRYRHPELGEFHKLNVSKGGITVALVPDAALLGLARYLNEAEMQRGGDVVQVLEQMLALENIEPPVWSERIDGAVMVMRRGRWVPNPFLKRLAPEKYKVQLELENRGDVINRELARYRFIPYVSRFGGRRQWHVSWQIQARTPKKHSIHGGVAQIDDGQALQLILDLARAGYLDRLRRCSRCGKWLYAKFRHQRFCSTKCQQTHYAHSDEWRRKRREYMRRYRRNTI